MKRIITFYILSCLSIILIWLAIDDYDIENQDFKFGLNVLILVTCVIYAPICTILASILYYFKINKAILSNRWLGILYCIFPFLCYKLLNIACVYVDIKINQGLEYSIPIIFIIQNVVIISKKSIQRRFLKVNKAQPGKGVQEKERRINK